VLDELRDGLTADSPLAIDFSQTFTPAGFSSGDTEAGVLSLQLPACARWDYSEPFPRSYLLCDKVAYAWNPGETSGRRFEISPDEQEGLDLLRLNVDELRQQYKATTESSAAGLEIHLEPVEESTTVSQATLTLPVDQSRLISLEFVDNEGNRTLFDLGGSRALDSVEFFAPPSGMEWLER
jgi:hypothetical protein